MQPPLLVDSVNGIPIRLNDERWRHITDEHGELAGLRFEVLETLEAPDRVLMGRSGELMAVRAQPDTMALVVVTVKVAMMAL